MKFPKEIELLKQQLAGVLPGFSAQSKMLPSVSYPVESLAVQENARKSGVLIVLFQKENKWLFPLIKRATKENDVHSGQISFPGGTYENKDVDLQTTALRETQEEIGIDTSEIEILGKLTSLYIGVSNYVVQPYVGYSKKGFSYSPDKEEVDYVVEVDVNEMVQKEILPTATFQRKDMQVSAPYYPVGDEKIWGATAMMLSEFFEVVRTTRFF